MKRPREQDGDPQSAGGGAGGLHPAPLSSSGLARAPTPPYSAGGQAAGVAGADTLLMNGVQLEIQNVTATFNLCIRLNLEDIARDAKNAAFIPTRLNACVMRLREPRSTALLFSSGRMVVTGAKGVEAANQAAEKYCGIVQQLGNIANLANPVVQCITATAELGFGILLERLVFAHARWCLYDPEVFPGVVYRLADPKVVVLVFLSGKVILTGGTSVQQLRDAFMQVDEDGQVYLVCQTHHLTTFAVAPQGLEPPNWNTIDPVGDFTVLSQYGTDKFLPLLVISIVVAFYLAHVELFRRIDGKHEALLLEIIRKSYLEQGRVVRAKAPILAKVNDKAHHKIEHHGEVAHGHGPHHHHHHHEPHDYGHHWKFEGSFSLGHNHKGSEQDPSGGQEHHDEHARQGLLDHLKYAAEAARDLASSILLNHTWVFLYRPGRLPVDSFRYTLLTRSQVSAVMLVDTMSAMAVQAVFYGKSQFSVNQKVIMVVTSMLFMMPALALFPWLLRVANMPPQFRTIRAAKERREIARVHVIQNKREAEFRLERQIEGDAASESSDEPDDVPLGWGNYALKKIERNRRKSSVQAVQKTKVVAFLQDVGHGDYLHDPADWRNDLYNEEQEGALEVLETELNDDIAQLHMILVLADLALCIVFFTLISVLFNMTLAASASRDERATLLNIATSFAITSLALEGVGLPAVITRSRTGLGKLQLWQCISASCLVVCASFLFAYSVRIAALVVAAGVTKIFTLYMLKVLLLYQQRMQTLLLAEIAFRWTTPTEPMLVAAIKIQNAYRCHVARITAERARESHAWLECRKERTGMYVLGYGTIGAATLGLLYTNLVFGAMFDRETSNGWLLTCVLSLVLESIIQQPVLLLVSGVLGDFAEQFSDVLIELFG